MKRVYIVRHGDVTQNGIPRYFGITDVALNKNGEKQLNSLLNFMQDKQIQSVHSSGLKRTKYMAEKIASVLKISNKIVPEFNEINFGKWEGLSFNEIKKIYPEEYLLWIEKKLNFIFPGGECLNDVRERVLPEYNKIISQTQNTENSEILMILHSSVIKVILCDALKSDNSFWYIEQDYAALNIIDYFPGTHVISLINDTNYINTKV